MKKYFATLVATAVISFSFLGSISPISANEVSTTTNVSAQVLEGGLGISVSKNNVDFGTMEAGDDGSLHPGSLDLHTKDNWKITVEGTQLSDGQKVLDRGSLTLDPVEEVLGTDNSDDASNIEIKNGDFVVDNGLSNTILETSEETNGNFSADFKNDALKLEISNDAKAGNYKSTITWKLVSGV